MPIAWHDDCLVNLRHSLEDELKALLNAERYVSYIKQNIKEYEEQIDRAKQEKRDGVDSEKFNKTRKYKEES